MTTAAIVPGVKIAGRYTIESVLGEGGMGTVFGAIQAFTERKVAIKVLHSSWGQNEVAVQRFVQEARVVAGLSHPNMAQVLDGGVDTRFGVFVVMERLEGQSLQKWLDDHQRLDVDEVERWIVPVMHALAVAHDASVLHRDVKPDNIYLAKQSDGTTVAKLLDFGISKIGTSSALVRTKTGSLIGTPSYMSPEQTRSEKHVDARTDVWSMGVVLYQSLTGMMPFEGNSIPTIVAAVLNAEPVAIERVRPELPRPLCAVIMNALQKDATTRIASLRLLADEVSRSVRSAHDPIGYAATVVPDAPSSRPPAPVLMPATRVAEDPTQPPVVFEKPIPMTTIAIPAVTKKQPAVERVYDEPVQLPVSGPSPRALLAIASVLVLSLIAIVVFALR